MVWIKINCMTLFHKSFKAQFAVAPRNVSERGVQELRKKQKEPPVSARSPS